MFMCPPPCSYTKCCGALAPICTCSLVRRLTNHFQRFAVPFRLRVGHLPERSFVRNGVVQIPKCDANPNPNSIRFGQMTLRTSELALPYALSLPLLCSVVKVRGGGAQPPAPCSHLSPPATVWAPPPLIKSIKCYFMPK